MAAEVSTIQSLRAVDAWIDVINANINGGVRTAYKTSRLKFGGSNTNVDRPGSATSLPLQFPEPSLTTTNSVIDFSQGAITVSTENTHLAIQGDGFFVVIDPGSVNTDGTLKVATSSTGVLISRDGEFRTNQNGLLVNSAGYFLVSLSYQVVGQLRFDSAAQNGVTTPMRAIYNDLDGALPASTATQAIKLTGFLTPTSAGLIPAGTVCADGVSTLPVAATPLMTIGNLQGLTFSTIGSTQFDIGYQSGNGLLNQTLKAAFLRTSSNVLTKSLEASNASMTQSVPELSLAQKLFSALTKIIQTHQTNTDAVINLIR